MARLLVCFCLFVLEIFKCSHGVGELEVCCASLEIAVVFCLTFWIPDVRYVIFKALKFIVVL